MIPDTLIVGNESDGSILITGTATVTGAGSSWQTNSLTVGFSGEGTLEITDGGAVTGDNSWIGIMPDAVGTVDVNGSGSTWTNTSELVVGIWGEGDVTIEDGAQVTTGTMDIGGFDVNEVNFDSNMPRAYPNNP